MVRWFDCKQEDGVTPIRQSLTSTLNTWQNQNMVFPDTGHADSLSLVIKKYEERRVFYVHLSR